MAYSISWDESSPAGASTQAATIDTELQQLKQSIRERMNDILDSSTAWETDADNPKLLDGAAIIKETPLVARVYPDGDLTISSGVTLVIAFNAESFDTGSYHDNSTNNSRLTISASAPAGYFRISGNLMIRSGATGGVFNLSILKNGSNLLKYTVPIASGAEGSFSWNVIDLGALTDYYEVNVIQASGVDYTLVGGTAFSTIFQIERIYGTP